VLDCILLDAVSSMHTMEGKYSDAQPFAASLDLVWIGSPTSIDPNRRLTRFRLPFLERKTI